MSNKKEKVLPVALVLFTGTAEEGSRISQLDDNSFVLMNVLFHRGDPERRTSLEFLVQFEDDDDAWWRPYDEDLGSTEEFLKYCYTKPELSLLDRTNVKAEKFLVDLNKGKIELVKPGDVVYLDIRQWDYKTNLQLFNKLNLEFKDTKTYVVEAKYGKYLCQGRKITLNIPIFNLSYERDNRFVYLYGRTKDFDSGNMILVDKSFAKDHPKVLGEW